VLLRVMGMKTILCAACLLANFSVYAQSTTERCVAAREAATSLLTAGSSTEEHTAKWRAAERHAFTVCTSSEVHVKLRNEAIVRWAGVLNDSAAELSLVKKALRETEAAEGPDSPLLLPLIDHLASFYSNQPAKRRDGLALAERGVRIRNFAFGETSSEVAEGLTLLGTFWFIEEMPDRNLSLAEDYLREAVAVAEKACGANCDALRRALGMLHAVLREQPGREKEAAELEKRIEKLYAADIP